MLYVKILLVVPALVFFYQLYRYALTRKGGEKERACFGIGIAYATAGIAGLALRGQIVSSLGLLLLTLGLLLLANGLQRREKTVFIDRYRPDEDE